jgi:hypothetical protein
VKVTLRRDKNIPCFITVNRETTAIFPVVRITLTYPTGMACVIQRIGTNNDWRDFIKAFWTGSQYSDEQIGEIIELVREADAMNNLDQGPVTVDFPEPSLLTEY